MHEYNNNIYTYTFFRRYLLTGFFSENTITSITFAANFFYFESFDQ